MTGESWPGNMIVWEVEGRPGERGEERRGEEGDLLSVWWPPLQSTVSREAPVRQHPSSNTREPLVPPPTTTWELEID